MCSSLPRRITLWRRVRAAASGSFEAMSMSAGSRPMMRSRIAPPTTYAGRRAGEDDVAGKERHHLRDELDEEVALENHLLGVAVLPDLAVHARLNAQARRIEFRLDVRTERTKRIERFRARELDVFLLKI